MKFKNIILSILGFCYTLFLSNQLFAAGYQQYIIENKAVDESSGLAASGAQKNILWTHNDSGNAPIIYAMDYEGKNKGSFYLDDVVNRDWEDMASFRWQNRDYLLVADTGDNYQINLTSYIYVFQEPIFQETVLQEQVRHELSNNASSRSPVWVIEYQYEDGLLYDVEAVTVDLTTQQILLLTKRTKTAQIFVLPLLLPSELLPSEQLTAEPVFKAKRLGELPGIKNPTAMDYSASRGQIAILSYGRVHLFDKKPQQSWVSTFRKPSQVLKFRGLYQPEALCFSVDGKQLFISSEKLPAKLLKIELSQP